ncbi:MAG: hypothetical protein CMH54_07570 [Myxococcales bacterium]|nr:hypothetical protein [Myxococcales bacterium]
MFHRGFVTKFALLLVLLVLAGLTSFASATTFEIIGIHQGSPAMFRALIRGVENSRSLHGLDMLEVEMTANGQVRRVPGVSVGYARKCQRAGLLDLYRFELRATQQKFMDSTELAGFDRPEPLVCLGYESTVKTMYALLDPVDEKTFVSWQCWLALGAGKEPLWVRVDAGPEVTRVVLGGDTVRTAEIPHQDVELRYQGKRKRAALLLKDVFRGPGDDSYIFLFRYSRPPLFDVLAEDVLVVFRSGIAEAQVLRPGVTR